MKMSLIDFLIVLCSLLLVCFGIGFIGAAYTAREIAKACNDFNNFTVNNVNYTCKVDEQVKGVNE